MILVIERLIVWYYRFVISRRDVPSSLAVRSRFWKYAYFGKTFNYWNSILELCGNFSHSSNKQINGTYANQKTNPRKRLYLKAGLTLILTMRTRQNRKSTPKKKQQKNQPRKKSQKRKATLTLIPTLFIRKLKKG